MIAGCPHRGDHHKQLDTVSDLGAPAALPASDLAVDGGGDNDRRPENYDEQKAWEEWWKTHPETPLTTPGQ